MYVKASGLFFEHDFRVEEFLRFDIDFSIL
jgi:hypothetical protein